MGHYSAEIKQQALDLHDRGYSVALIVAEIGDGAPSAGTITRWILDRRHGRDQNREKFVRPYHQVGEAVAMVLVQGMSRAAVAEVFKCSESTVRGWIKNYAPDPDMVDLTDFEAVRRATMGQVSTSRQKSPKPKATPTPMTGPLSGPVKKPGAQPQETSPGQEDGPEPVCEDAGGGDQSVPEHRTSEDTVPEDVASVRKLAAQGLVSAQWSEEELPDDIAELKRLLRQERLHRAVNEAAVVVLGKAVGSAPVPGVGQLGNRDKALVIAVLKKTFPVTDLLKALQISKSSYCYARRRILHPVEDRHGLIKDKIVKIAEDNNLRYGYRKIHQELKRGKVTVSEKIVREMMKDLGLVPPRKVGSKYSSYQGENDHCPDNLLRIDDDDQFPGGVNDPSSYFTTFAGAKGLTHDFHADAPNRKWVTDISEIACTDGKLYLSPIIDLYDGYPVSVRISEHPDMDLVLGMLTEALDTLAPGQRPILHSDRGSHYRSKRWVEAITTTAGEDTDHGPTYRVIPSMSRKATSGDNAAMEGFFGTLKRELIHGRPEMKRMTRKQMIQALEEYIEWYIHDRLKATLGYQTLAEHRGMTPTNNPTGNAA